ncbi:hypothetical protein JXA47_02040 [Candidatus Sumerlaeota bacterium]|nr:hypothetical protein [Candidatus Sumerlaeota bacterium]
MLRKQLAGLGSLLAIGLVGLGAAQTQSWAHIQFEGVTNELCSVTLTLGSTVITLPDIPVDTTASQVCEALEQEINSARYGHLYHAACNGVDFSILSIIADGSPTRSRTPWLGRLIPTPQVSIQPGNCGLKSRGTRLDDTVVAVCVEGTQTEVTRAAVNVRLNGRPLSLQLGGVEEEVEQTSVYSAEEVAENLAQTINSDPGFRASTLRDDTGQIMIFITSENMGGGVQLQDGPTSVQGLNFQRSRILFASEPLYAAPGRNP